MQSDSQSVPSFDPAIHAPSNNPSNNWTQLLQSLGGYGNWRTDAAVQTALFQKISYFSLAHRNRPEHTEMVLYSLSRGCSLNRAALEWEKPYAGKAPTRSQDTAWLRGVQWRLVMSYNAFELVCVALMQPPQTLTPEVIKAFVQKCNLKTYTTPIASPNQQRAGIQQWLDQSVPAGVQGNALLDFLGLRAGDRKAFQAWALPQKAKENPIVAWDQAILLAKALRNMSAHGSLSASKIRELGLRQAFEILPRNLADVIDTAIGKLI